MSQKTKGGAKMVIALLMAFIIVCGLAVSSLAENVASPTDLQSVPENAWLAYVYVRNSASPSDYSWVGELSLTKAEDGIKVLDVATLRALLTEKGMTAKLSGATYRYGIGESLMEAQWLGDARAEESGLILFPQVPAETGLFVMVVPVFAAEPTAEPVATEEPATTEEPVATEDSAATEVPAATEEPAVTEVPAATEEPAATEVPVATDEPAVTEVPVATEEPAATEVPVATEEPIATEVPVATEEPIATEVPVATEEPAATEAPAATDEPAATEVPAATDEPAVTEVPAATEEPAATEVPAATDEPTATEAPAATDEPTTTEVPVATDEPAATEASAATEEPTPTIEPTAEPTTTVEPTAVPTPTAEPTAELTATVEPTAEPTPIPLTYTVQVAFANPQAYYCYGDTLTLVSTIKVTEGELIPVYQWQVQTAPGEAWVNIEGAVAPEYSFVLDEATSTYRYRVVVLNQDATEGV